MPNTYTLYYNLAKPAKFDLDWEDELNSNFDNIDQLIKNVNNALDTHKADQTNPHEVTFLQLTDTPSSYSGLANRVVVVNNTANGLTTVTKVPAAVAADYTLSIRTSATFPENPNPGETFFNTSDNKMYLWNNTQWIEVHPKDKDQYLDYGGANQVSASQAKSAYSQSHAHSNKALLDTYNQTNANLSDAVTKKHTQNTDQYLDYGGANQVSATDVKDAVSKKHTQNTDTGTTSTTFQLNSGSSGAKIKDNSGVLEARNSADSAYAIIRSAYPSGDNDVVTKGYVDGIPKYDQQARAMALWGL